MKTRREFIEHAVSAGAMVSACKLAWATEPELGFRTSVKAGNGLRVKSVVRREETTLRLGGIGDNFHMSWAANDRQLVAMCDGLGWSEQPRAFYNSRLYAIDGGPHKAVFEELVHYPELISIPNTDNMMRYYGFGTLAIGGHIYQYLSTPNHKFVRPDLSPAPGARFVGAKLIYSPDDGRTWCNQDGTSPVVWEAWDQRSRANMVFFEESQEAFSLLSILQMGMGYAANRDGYVYVYAPNGNIEGQMNQLVMFRVPKSQILRRGAYEYFAGLRHGKALWTKDIETRAVVHTFPHGWVNTTLHPWAWMPSVTYNSPLGLYMMASWGTGSDSAGRWFGRPSYLGLWISEHPWGPWNQIHEEHAWSPQGDAAARAFAPQIAPMWISQDGRSFWLVWSDFQSVASPEESSRLKEQSLRVKNIQESVQNLKALALTKPHYAFNTQRVDLLLG